MVKVRPYKKQNYDKLKKEAIQSGELFFDPAFPPNSSSLFYSKTASDSIVWKRPGVCSLLTFLHNTASLNAFIY